MKGKKIALLLGVLMLGALLLVGCAVEEPITPVEQESKEPVEVVAASYVGSESCKTCHSGAYEGWMGTEHPFMIQDASEIWPESKAALEAELAKGDSKFLKIGDTDKNLQSLDDIVYIVGQWKKQRFVVKTDEGFKFLQTQYYPDGNEGSKLYSYGENKVYEDRCLACHSTGFDLEATKTLDRTAADYMLENVVAELGVGCESCHGVGSEHAKAPKDNIINPANLTVAQQNDLCGSCHARNSGNKEFTARNDAVGYQIGDTLKDFVKVLSPANNENVWKKVENGEITAYYDKESGGKMRFWGDGSSSAHRQQYNDLEYSMKFNIMSCSTCHDPHDTSALKGGSWEGLISLDLGSNTCTNCHTDIANWDLDEKMPKNAKSQNVKDIRQHTFGAPKPAADISETK
ncbi:MAG: cytochrome c3 family protein [Bacillota bacterium]|nr:cytochrome c3 family protein [Bacillota bacterium]